jgi:hypothetical protein
MDKGLRFRGASIHSQEDIDAAVVALVGYIDAVQGSSTARSESDATWLQEAPHDVAAELAAFLYTQYGLIYRSQASDKQLVAFERWRKTGRLPGDVADSRTTAPINAEAHSSDCDGSPSVRYAPVIRR